MTQQKEGGGTSLYLRQGFPAGGGSGAAKMCGSNDDSKFFLSDSKRVG